MPATNPMTSSKYLTLWTVFLNFFIPVGGAHGVACIGYIEVFGLSKGYKIGDSDLSLSLTSDYFRSLGAVALCFFVGQILLILSLALRNYYTKFWTKILGLGILWVGFYYLTHNFFNEIQAEPGLYFGIPFLIVSILLAYRTIKQYAVVRSEDKG